MEKTDIVTIRVPKGVKDECVRLAESEQRSLSNWLMRVILNVIGGKNDKAVEEK